MAAIPRNSGHTAEHTVADMETAFDLTRSEGLIFVDDYYNPSWPGVQEGVARLYLASTPRWLPLAYIGNKLVLCHLSHHERCLDFVAQHLAGLRATLNVKRTPRFGYASLTVILR